MPISYGDSYASPTDIERISPVSQEYDEDFQHFLHKIDQLLDGGIEDQSEAYTMLKNKEHEVGICIVSQCSFWYFFIFPQEKG